MDDSLSITQGPLNNEWRPGEFTPVCISNREVRTRVEFHQWTPSEIEKIKAYKDSAGGIGHSRAKADAAIAVLQNVIFGLEGDAKDMANPEARFGRKSFGCVNAAKQYAAQIFGHIPEEPANRWIVIGTDGDWTTTCGVSCIKVTPEQFVKISRGDIRPDDAYVLEEHGLPE